jgi:hypothetical protein
MDDSFITSVAPIDKGDETLFVIDRTAAGSRRVIAAQDIAKGTRIWAEKPIIKFPNIIYDPTIAEKQVAETVKTLSKDYQRAFFSLSNMFTKAHPKILGIATTNSLSIDRDRHGVFLQAAILNHSCRNNAFNAFNAASNQLTVYSIQDIKKGDEITINYIPNKAICVRSERQKALRTQRFFICRCSLCTAPEPERLESDARCKQMTEIDRQIGDGSKAFLNYEEGPLPLIHKMIKLLRDEGIVDDHICKAYHDAFRIAVGNRDYVRSKIFIKRCHRYHVQVEGEDGPGTTSIKKLVDKACAKTADGGPKKESARDVKLPRKRQGLEFNQWLWREGHVTD